MLKTKNTDIKTAERITRLKKIPCRSIEFNIQYPYYIKQLLHIWKITSKGPFFKTLGINPRELTARKSEARWTFFRFGDGRVKTGAPNENIVQNHLNIALLNVFQYLNDRYRHIFIP